MQAGFFEEVPVSMQMPDTGVGNRFDEKTHLFQYDSPREETRLLKLPFTKPPPVSFAYENDCDQNMLRLRLLLTAHEASLAALKQGCADAHGLAASFEPLLKMVQEIQGVCVTSVELSPQSPWQGAKGALPVLKSTQGFIDELPEALQRIQPRELKVVSPLLKELPDWLFDVRLQVLELEGKEVWQNSDEYYDSNIAAFYDYQPSGVVMWRDGKITWGSLNSIPASVIRLQELRQLTLKYLPVIKQLPEECCMLTGLKHLILQSLPRLERLPVSFRGFKTQLHSLKLIDLPALQDMPTCFEGCTLLRELTIPTDRFELKHCWALACSLPSLINLRSLEFLALGWDLESGNKIKLPTKDHGRTLARAVGLALKAWPLPRLNRLEGIDLSLHWDALEFISPPESPEWVEASWESIDFARHFAVQQEKMLAFACGLHVRLGAASFGVSPLYDQVLVMIADDLLGRGIFEKCCATPPKSDAAYQRAVQNPLRKEKFGV